MVKEKENLLGDGVNIAARLEALAQTCGITLSKSVYDFVNGKTSHEFNDIGLQKVKQNEFHAFDLLLDGLEKRKEKKPFSKKATSGAIASIVLILLVAIVYFTFSMNSKKVDLEVAANKKSY